MTLEMVNIGLTQGLLEALKKRLKMNFREKKGCNQKVGNWVVWGWIWKCNTNGYKRVPEYFPYIA